MEFNVGDNVKRKKLSVFHSQISALCALLPRETVYGDVIASEAPRVLAILDIYQARSLRRFFTAISVGVRDGGFALEYLAPKFVLFQTTEATAHQAWSGKLKSEQEPNAHLIELAEEARARNVPVVALNTVTPDKVSEYSASLKMADVVLVTRTDAVETARTLLAPSQILLGPREVIDIVVGSTAGPSLVQPFIEALAEVYFSAGLAAARAGEGQPGGPL